MSDENKVVSRLFSSSLEEIFGGEDLLLEVAREMIKDEIKEKIKRTLNDDPELKAEFKQALEIYYDAKIRQALAAFKIAKASARLGVKLAPEDIQEQLKREIEVEINRIIVDTL